MAFWSRWRRGGGASIRWWRAEIAREQIKAIRERVEIELYRRRLSLVGRVPDSEDYEMIRQLELRLSAIDASRAAIDRFTVKKRRLFDRLMVGLWHWAIRGRFDLTQERARLKKRARSAHSGSC